MREALAASSKIVALLPPSQTAVSRESRRRKVKLRARERAVNACRCRGCAKPLRAAARAPPLRRARHRRVWLEPGPLGRLLLRPAPPALAGRRAGGLQPGPPEARPGGCHQHPGPGAPGMRGCAPGAACWQPAGAAILVLWPLWLGSPALLLLTALAIPLSLSYSFPVFGRRLKDVPVLKTLFAPLVVLMAVLAPPILLQGLPVRPAAPAGRRLELGAADVQHGALRPARHRGRPRRGHQEPPRAAGRRKARRRSSGRLIAAAPRSAPRIHGWPILASLTAAALAPARPRGASPAGRGLLRMAGRGHALPAGAGGAGEKSRSITCRRRKLASRHGLLAPSPIFSPRSTRPAS